MYEKMATDTNWCLRKRYFANIRDFCEPTYKIASNNYVASAATGFATLTKDIFD